MDKNGALSSVNTDGATESEQSFFSRGTFKSKVKASCFPVNRSEISLHTVFMSQGRNEHNLSLINVNQKVT